MAITSHERADKALERRKLHGIRTILFVDEVHRWNKAQQDALLPHVENGTVTLIGATTENPYFEVIGALVSRSRVFQLRALEDEAMRRVLGTALSDRERGYGERKIQLDEDAVEHLVRVAGGDARNALNALELAVESTPQDEAGAIHITLEIAQESIQRRAVLYDKDGDAHYDTISAYIKSVRGSDPDAALYWLAKMLYAGEDPRFILRRLLILAGEDIGLGDPLGLVVASAAAQAFDYVGLPEGIYPIVEATCLSTAPNQERWGIFKAQRSLQRACPQHLQDATRTSLGHTKLPVPTRAQISCRSRTCRVRCWGPISTSPPARAMRPRWSNAWPAGELPSGRPWGLPGPKISQTCPRKPSTKSNTNIKGR
jgi:putative ATPase